MSGLEHLTSELEHQLEIIAEKNLLVNNLFQLTPTCWQANLTDGQMSWEFGRGETPAAALQAALLELENPGLKLREQKLVEQTTVSKLVNQISIKSLGL